MSKKAKHTTIEEAIALGPPPKGNLAIPVYSYGSMEAELYTPENIDTQSPHQRDEIYIIANGSSEFFNGKENISVKEGSMIFVPAGVDHRFINFTEGFLVWVIFYGPKGGEVDE